MHNTKVNVGLATYRYTKVYLVQKSTKRNNTILTIKNYNNKLVISNGMRKIDKLSFFRNKQEKKIYN